MAACADAGVRNVATLIAGYPEPQRATVNALRALIREVAPHLDESVKWGKPAYGRGPKTLCSLVPHIHYVNLQVFNGAGLPDPDRLLEGTGKSLRHVKCRTTADAERPALRDLVLQSLAAADLVAP